MGFYHTTKEGQKIALSDIELGHLNNICQFLLRRAKEGIMIQYGSGVSPNDGDIYYDRETIYGEEALQHLNYYQYKKELDKRLKTIKYANLQAGYH